MTRRIDWRDGATRADRVTLKMIDAQIADHDLSASNYRKSRKRLIARCYAKAARAAKRGR